MSEATNYYDLKALHDAELLGSGEEDGDDMAFKRFQWFWEGRVENGVLSQSGLLKNYGDKLSQYFADEICAENENSSPWEMIGPDHYSGHQHMGKIQCLWMDESEDPPMLIYAGSAHGGLWKSTDGGDSWENITDSYSRPVLGVYSIARMEDLSPPRLIIGTGSVPEGGYSLGVLWSDDEGASWNISSGIPTASSNGTVMDLQVYGDEVLAVQAKRVWRSGNHGQYFTEITPNAVTIDNGIPPDPNNLFNGIGHYLGGGGDGVIVLTALDGDPSGDGPDIYASDDLGYHWTKITDELPIAASSEWHQDFPVSGSVPSYYNHKWHNWDVLQNDPDLWDFQYGADAFGQVGTAFIVPTVQSPYYTATYYCRDPTIDDDCEVLVAPAGNSQVLRVQFVKDGDAELNIYLTNDVNDPGSYELVYSTEPYPGIETDEEMPVVTFTAAVDYYALVMEARFEVPGYVPVTGIRVDRVEIGGDQIAMSQISVVNDPGGPYDGFHILTRANGSAGTSNAHLYSGQSLSSIALRQVFGDDCEDVFEKDFLGNYHRFHMNKFGRAFASGVYSIHEADISVSPCEEIELGYDYLQIPYWAPGHVDIRSFFVVDGASAGDERIIIGHDGGIAYRDAAGSWHDMNGVSLPNQMIYDLGIDEFATHLLAGAQDNETWEKIGDAEWQLILSGTDGASAGVYRNRTGSVNVKSYVENKKVLFNGSYVDQFGMTQTLNLSHSSEGCCFRLYWPSVINVSSGIPRLYVVHSFDDGNSGVVTPAGIVQLDPDHPNGLDLTAATGVESYEIGALAVHPNDDDVIFYGVNSNYGSWSTVDGRFMRTIDHAATPWVDLGPNLTIPGSPFSDDNLLSRWGIGCIEIDPDSDPSDIDHMTVYVGMKGLPDVDESERVMKSSDGGATWEDMSAGLPGFPVNDLECQQGSGGILYAATDIGVYVFDPSTGHWQCFNEGLPVCIVSGGMDANECTGKLYVSTYGRSVWRTDLYKPQHVTERQLLTDELISGEEISTQSIRVAPGATLTITGELYFYPHRKLIIEPGGKVDLNGGKLSSQCGNFWKGVEVLGDPNQSQIPMTNQGYLLMTNGAVIENAEVGVSLFGTDEYGNLIPQSEGGVVQGYSSTIRNCKRQVWMRKYKNMYNGIEYPNWSKFQNTDFLLTVDYDQTASYPDMVRLEGVKDIQFGSCEFQYQHEVEAGLARPIGIRSFNSSFSVAGNSGFWWLSAGVRANDYTGMKPCYIRDSQFKYNDRGIILTGVHNAEITGNSFDIPTGDGSWPLDQSMPPWPIPYGVYLYGCSGYEVEDNMMTGVNYIGNVGLTIKKSDQVADEFYRNHFANLYVGSLMQGKNQIGVDGDGLQFGCNVYGNEDGTNECIYSAAATQNDAAIAESQGGPNDPIGNRFYPDCPGGTDTDVYFDGDSPDGTIYHHHSDPVTEPLCSSPPPHVSLYNTFEGFTPGDGPTSSCPKDPSVITGTGQDKMAFQIAVGDHVQLKALYEGELDGGDSEYLLVQVSDPLVSSFNLRNLLLASMPVKDAVLLAALERAPAMDPWHLTQVLLDASPLNPDVLLAVLNSDLDESYKIMIREQQEEEDYSWKQWIEAELSGLRHDVERARHDYVRKVLRDTVGNPLDSILLVLEDQDMPATPQERLWLLMAREQWQEVDEWINDPIGHGLTEDEATAFGVVREVVVDPGNATDIVQDAQDQLGPIAADENNPAQTIARALLAAHLDLSFEEPMVLPGEERSTIEAFTSSPKSDRGLIRVQPNPAKDRALVITHLPMQHVMGYIALYNVYGVELERIRIYTGPAVFELELNKYEAGLYRIALKGRRGEILDGVSLTIAR